MTRQPERPRRAFMYHSTCPTGQIFNEDEFEAKIEQGWVDCPTKVPAVAEQETDSDADSDDPSEVLAGAQEQAEQIIQDARAKAAEIETFAVNRAESIIKTANEEAAAITDTSGSDEIGGYPVKRGDVWFDSADASYDTAQHSFPDGSESPSVNKDGTFRKLPAK